MATNLSKVVDMGGLDLIVKNLRYSKSKGNAAKGAGYRPVYIPTTALTLTADDNNGFIALNAAAGFTTILPAPQVGLSFDFTIRTTVTSGTMKIITDAATTFLVGSLFSSITATPTMTVRTADGTTHRALNMDGTTQGGYIGTTLRFVCTSATQWSVSGFLPQTGSVATPFATS